MVVVGGEVGVGEGRMHGRGRCMGALGGADWKEEVAVRVGREGGRRGDGGGVERKGKGKLSLPCLSHLPPCPWRVGCLVYWS